MNALHEHAPSDDEHPTLRVPTDADHVAFAGLRDFVRAVLADPSMLEAIPKGGPDGYELAIVGEGVPPRDIAAYAGKAIYVHRLSPEGVEELQRDRERFGA